MEKTKRINKAKLTAVAIILGLALFCVPVLKNQIVLIVKASDVSGWLWGGSEDANMSGTVGSWDGTGNNDGTGVGWINMNASLNCDTNGNGKLDAQCGGNDTTTAVHNYKVSIPETDGPVTGYAWSSNLGWIQFDPSGPYPAIPNHAVKRAGNKLTGWARISAVEQESARANSGGWQGWIKLSSEAGDPAAYGVTVNPDGALTGHAWNGETAGSGSNMAEGLGWISFSKARMPMGNKLVICASCDAAETPIYSALSLVTQGVPGTTSASVKACKVPASQTTCAGPDITSDVTTTWSSSNTSVATVTRGNINSGTSAGNILITASTSEPGFTYPSSNVPVSVSCPCGDSEAVRQTICEGEYLDANGCACTGLKDCKSKWKEVTP